MVGDTQLFCLAFPARNQFQRLWDARIYASPVGNPFARRPNFYRKVATIRRQFGNEKGGGLGLVPRTQRSAISAFTRVFDAPWPRLTLTLSSSFETPRKRAAPQDDG
jgi:hypothetical protein